MPVQKADIVAKVDLRETLIGDQYKVKASDINELKRASDETIDYALGLGAAPAYYCGLFICEGQGPAQTIASGQKILIDQWTSAQPCKGTEVQDGDQSLTIDEPGIYEVRFTISYETSARGGEIFKIRTVDNGSAVPGICTRVQHQHPGTTTYNAAAGRLVKYTDPKTISLEFEALTLDSPRTITVRHASLSFFRVDTI